MDLRLRLLLSSALMLFLELALIRWTAANIIHLGYFSNFVLLGSFLGIGVGFLRAGRGITRFPIYFPVVLGVLVWGVWSHPVVVDRSGSDVIFFTALHTSGPPAWLVLPIVFIGTAFIMAGPGELVGQCFERMERLDAYRWDLLGSLVGIGAFSVLAFVRTPSVVWGVVVALLVLVLAPRVVLPLTVSALAMVLLVGTLGAESLEAGTTWSPYNKLVTNIEQSPRYGTVVHVSANGVPHQSAVHAATKAKYNTQYGYPYKRRTGGVPQRVLVVGAGTGNDVSLALERGASHVDAVEIDPGIYAIGKKRNPDHVYQDPRVNVHIDDGRAFLSRDHHKYDLIVFALPDSLTLVAGASSLRLESYLFTEESLKSVKKHLAPGGSFSMYNSYRQQWLIGRLANTAAAAFGHEPCVDTLHGANQAVITAGLTAADQNCGVAAAGDVTAIPPGPAPSHDDRPFLYLKNRSIPGIYLWALLGILLTSLIAVRVFGGPYRKLRPYSDLFMLGAAFLLLETRSITTFALLFGTTWVVNAIVFTGVLLVVLLAVEVTRHVKTPPLPILYAALAGSLLLVAVLPPATLLSLPVVARGVLAIGINFAPIFIANLIFAKRFATTADGASAFGANLLGAMVGGCLEYTSLVIGYSGLIAIAAVLYLLAFALTPDRAGLRVGVPVP